jgi:ubiquinone/menaquinone biosynthesis C-methylase UbiE
MEDVRAYWEWYIDNTQVPEETCGSRGFFESIRVGHENAYSCANDALRLPRLRGRSLLELGCGIGFDTVQFAQHGARVTAIDVSPRALELAQKHLQYHGLKPELELGNAEALCFDDETFDFVVARGLLMFTPDDRRVVQEILRVLKPGGEAQLLLHNRFSWYVVLGSISGTAPVHERGTPPINRLYSLRQARKMAERFSSYRISFGRPPAPTNRTGIPAQLFNGVFVPLARCIPEVLMRPFGYYIIVNAVKGVPATR